jgi:hypothetical protein
MQKTYEISGVGTVTIAISSGDLVLVDVSAPGWSIEVDKAESDKIEVEFRKGSAEAEFEAEIEHGQLDIEIETDFS